MPFETPEYNVAPARRSSRQHLVPEVPDPATPAPPLRRRSGETPAIHEGTPLTRREARERARLDTAASTETSTAAPVIAESAESCTAEPLVAPAVSDTADHVTAPVPSAAEASIDEFEHAARLFSFSGEAAVHPAMPAGDSKAPVTEPVFQAREPRRRRPAVPGASFKRMAAASFSVGAMAIVGLMTVGMTTPAEAVSGTDAALAAALPADDVLDADSDEIQAYVAPAEVQNLDLGRTETYSTATLVDLAGTVGITNFSSANFSNDPNCSIQWPFAVGVEMTWGYGMRSGRLHEGVDFTPGEGAHIQSIADGVVRISTDSGGAFGATIVIDHVVDGQLVSSRYAHLVYGSRQVEVGDQVSVGQFIGQTGNTGYSFGAHTHMEVLQNGTTAIDPLPWLRSHATC